ncbi:MAG: BtpA/SgcQ family protein [Candidatus Pacearchaeota archaeon]|jgi:hypothetical protein
MSNEREFSKLFSSKKPIIGMIHLAGRKKEDKVTRALEELAIYDQEGVSGAIIEDYHGSSEDVEETLRQSNGRFNLVLGINVLRNPYGAFKLAADYGARFVQFDSVQTKDLDLSLYENMRGAFPNILVLGGVGFKYISPTGNPLEIDLEEGKSRCEAIVTTGDGTGMETPLEKLRQYQELLRDFPLIVGAGVNLRNVCEQLQVCDGAIVGSYFKPEGNTQLPVDRMKVRDLIHIVGKMRD